MAPKAPRRIPYGQALEVSWPRGRFLVQLMDGVPTSKRERLNLKALRGARTALEAQIAKLTAEKEAIEADIRKECPHLPEFLSVAEVLVPAADGNPARTKYTVECSSCMQTLRRHYRNENG